MPSLGRVARRDDLRGELPLPRQRLELVTAIARRQRGRLRVSGRRVGARRIRGRLTRVGHGLHLLIGLTQGVGSHAGRHQRHDDHTEDDPHLGSRRVGELVGIDRHRGLHRRRRNAVGVRQRCLGFVRQRRHQLRLGLLGRQRDVERPGVFAHRRPPGHRRLGRCARLGRLLGARRRRGGFPRGVTALPARLVARVQPRSAQFTPPGHYGERNRSSVERGGPSMEWRAARARPARAGSFRCCS